MKQVWSIIALILQATVHGNNIVAKMKKSEVINVHRKDNEILSIVGLGNITKLEHLLSLVYWFAIMSRRVRKEESKIQRLYWICGHMNNILTECE